MGGRGSKSGLSAPTGFSYQMNGKTIVVQKTKAGVVLINGAPNKTMSYEKLLQGAKEKAGFKKLSAEDIEKARKQKSEKPDYEMGIRTPWGNKDNRKAARQSRLASRRK